MPIDQTLFLAVLVGRLVELALTASMQNRAPTDDEIAAAFTKAGGTNEQWAQIVKGVTNG